MSRTASSNSLGVADLAMQAGADLSAKQYYCVVADTDEGDVVLAGANVKIMGVLQNAPASGYAATIRTARGVTTKVIAGDVVAVGDFLSTDSSGRVVKASGAKQIINGQALSAAAAAGEVIEMIILDDYVE